MGPTLFDINNSRDFYQKLLEDFDDYMGNTGSARHAMNCAITAHHMHDWVWVDFLKRNIELRKRLGIKSRNDFIKWIVEKSIWFSLVQGISNGSKHMQYDPALKAQHVGGWGVAKWDEHNWGQTHLVIDMGGDDPGSRYMHIATLLEVVVRFWRDFLRAYGPYPELPVGKTQLATP